MKRGKLGRSTPERRALFRALTKALILNGRIETTHAKAKAVRTFVDHMITLGKQGDLHSRRQAAEFLDDAEAVKKLFESVAPQFKNREGGYTRVLQVGNRRGDGAPTAIIELVK